MSTNTKLYLQSSIQACKTRAVLTSDQAAEIFKIHLLNKAVSGTDKKQHMATQVASAFGVSEKTVRDIWTGRTWFLELMHLDPARAARAAERLRLPGRPNTLHSMLESKRLSDSEYECFSPISAKRRRRPTRSSPSPATAAGTIGDPTLSPASSDGHQASEGSACERGSPSSDRKAPPLDFLGHPQSVDTPSPSRQTLYARPAIWSSFSQLWERCAAAEAPPLPASSRADDPFHDDWGHWAEEGRWGDRAQG